MSTIPDKIGKYKIVRPLGSGLMGDVFLGEHSTPSGKEFMAIKMLDPKLVIRRGDAAKFMSEIAHPNFMRYLSIEPVAVGSDKYYIVMDFLEVRPVSRRSLKTTLSNELLEHFAVVAEGCKMSHDKGVIHGNIKPSNLLIRQAAGKVQPILTDWGLDYVFSPDVFVGETFKKTVTYMAPEAAQRFFQGPDSSIKLTPAADIYSMTQVLLETLIRKQLFRAAGSLDELLALKKNFSVKLLNVNYPKRNVDIKALNELITRNMSADPSKRMQDMKQVADAFRAAIVKEAVAL